VTAEDIVKIRVPKVIEVPPPLESQMLTPPNIASPPSSVTTIGEKSLEIIYNWIRDNWRSPLRDSKNLPAELLRKVELNETKLIDEEVRAQVDRYFIWAVGKFKEHNKGPGESD
jgi:hypothetical protein